MPPECEKLAMKAPREPSKATLDRIPDMTGRDGAIDFAAKESTAEHEVSDHDGDRFRRVMGAAAIDLWSDLPQAIQEQMFERAVLLGHRAEPDEMLREQLAKYLHDHHKRTVEK